MSIHMIRLQTARNATLRQWLTTWLNSYKAWEDADEPNQPPTDTTIRDPDTGTETEAMTADWRFAWQDNSKEVLLGNLVAYSRSYASFGVIGHHECDHSDPPENRQGCPPFDFGLPDGFSASIQSGVWGNPPATVDPRDNP